MLLVFVKAIASFAVGRQGHPVEKQALHGTIVFRGEYLALTDIAKFCHMAPPLSPKDTTSEDR